MKTTIYERGRIIAEEVTVMGPDDTVIVQEVDPNGNVLRERPASPRELQVSEANEAAANRYNEWVELEALIAALPSNNLSKPIFERMARLLRSRFYEG